MMVPNMCIMTRMRPTFEDVAIGGEPAPYRVLRYREGVRSVSEVNGRILFVPGNGGSFRQARSLGKVLSPSQALYSIDLGGEMAAFDGRLLARQARFVAKCVKVLEPLAIVGHSIGGIVAILAVVEHHNVFVVTLAAPLGRHPFAVDVVLDRVTRRATSRNRHRIISISGGVRDWQVPDWLSASNFTASDLVAPGLSTDHQSILWCNQIIRIVAKFLSHISESGNSTFFGHERRKLVAKSLMQSSTLGFASRFWSNDNSSSLVVFAQLGVWALPRSIAIVAALLLDETFCKVALPAIVASVELVANDSSSPSHTIALAAAAVLLVLAELLSDLRRISPRNWVHRFVAERRGVVICCAMALSVASEFHALPCLVASAFLAQDDAAAILAACTSAALLPGYIAVLRMKLSEKETRLQSLDFPPLEEFLLSVICLVVARAPSPTKVVVPRKLRSVAALWCVLAAALGRPRYLIDCILAYDCCSLAASFIACTKISDTWCRRQ